MIFVGTVLEYFVLGHEGVDEVHIFITTSYSCCWSLGIKVTLNCKGNATLIGQMETWQANSLRH